LASGWSRGGNGKVPATIHNLRSRAACFNHGNIGPSPSASARPIAAASRRPMAAKFSGSTASRAPPSAACSSKARALARLASTSSWLTI